MEELNQAGGLRVVRLTERLRKALWHSGVTGYTTRGIRAEHRLEQRLPLSSRGVCTVEGRLERAPIDVFDLSLQGVRFGIDEELRAGDRCRLVICLPAFAPCHMNVVVRWVAVRRIDGRLRWQAGARLEPATARRDTCDDASP